MKGTKDRQRIGDIEFLVLEGIQLILIFSGQPHAHTQTYLCVLVKWRVFTFLFFVRDLTDVGLIWFGSISFVLRLQMVDQEIRLALVTKYTHRTRSFLGCFHNNKAQAGPFARSF